MARQGWYISYIDRDPAVLARQEALERMKQKELEEQDRHNRMLDRLVEEAREKAATEAPAVEYTGSCFFVMFLSGCLAV